MSSTEANIKAGESQIFRKLYIKRRDTTTGLYESEWYEITKDVITWGSFSAQVDKSRRSKFKFPSAQIKVHNALGLYNPNDDENSLWNGYAPQQRTLVKIEAGYLHQTLAANGVWVNTAWPGGTDYNTHLNNIKSEWSGDTTVFIGVIAGDLFVSDADYVMLNVQPLNEVFRRFAARNLNSFDANGQTGSEFMEALRDQTDGAGTFIFRSFFGDTTTNWDIATTTQNYAYMDSVGAKHVRDKTAWEVIERLAEADNHVCYITPKGVFKYQPRNVGATSQFTFNGSWERDGQYGNTIKRILRYGQKFTKFYSRVEVKHKEADTWTSLEIKESGFTVTGGNTPWYYGEKTFQLENTWIPDTATAATIANDLFNELSSIKNEIKFTTSFVPQLSILDKITINYDSSGLSENSLWDVNLWADTAGGSSLDEDLVWDASKGNSIRLVNQTFAITSIKMDLDKLQCTFEARKE